MTGPMSTSACSFPLFSRLPPELRIQIWNEAIPEDLTPAFWPYRKGYWRPRQLAEWEEGYHAQCSIEFEYRHDCLDPIQVAVPFALVNHEARNVGLAWLRKRGFISHRSEDRKCHIYGRPFNPSIDILYIPQNKVDEFCCEPYERLFEPDLLHQSVHSSGQHVKRFAVPEVLLRDEVRVLPEMVDWFTNLTTLFVVTNNAPEPVFGEGDFIESKMFPRWEIGERQGEVLVWHPNKFRFIWGQDRCTYEEKTYSLIEEAGEVLITWLLQNKICSFEIWPVSAVKA